MSCLQLSRDSPACHKSFLHISLSLWNITPVQSYLQITLFYVTLFRRQTCSQMHILLPCVVWCGVLAWWWLSLYWLLTMLPGCNALCSLLAGRPVMGTHTVTTVTTATEWTPGYLCLIPLIVKLSQTRMLGSLSLAYICCQGKTGRSCKHELMPYCSLISARME